VNETSRAPPYTDERNHLTYPNAQTKSWKLDLGWILLSWRCSWVTWLSGVRWAPIWGLVCRQGSQWLCSDIGSLDCVSQWHKGCHCVSQVISVRRPALCYKLASVERPIIGSDFHLALSSMIAMPGRGPEMTFWIQADHLMFFWSGATYQSGITYPIAQWFS